MPPAITSTTELRAEILRLRLQKTWQEADLKLHFNSPKALWNTAISLLRKSNKDIDAAAPLDIWTRISKALLPLALDKTLFRESNFMVRALVRMISRNAATHVDKKSVAGFWEKLKEFLPIISSEKSAISDKRGNTAKRLT